MLFQLLLVLFTFALGSVGGLVFSRYYFATSDTSTVRLKDELSHLKAARMFE
jgi:hypothetical protein